MKKNKICQKKAGDRAQMVHQHVEYDRVHVRFFFLIALKQIPKFSESPLSEKQDICGT